MSDEWFNVKDHEFTDNYITEAKMFTGGMVAIFTCDDNHIQLSKSDVIALAKHYKLTEADLFQW